MYIIQYMDADYTAMNLIRPQYSSSNCDRWYKEGPLLSVITMKYGICLQVSSFDKNKLTRKFL